MDLVVDIARHEFAEDFVIGSGVTWHGRQFVEELFGRHGFDYSAHIEERVSDRCAGPRFVVSTEKLSRLVGRSPREDILSVCDRMLTTHLQTGTTGS
jgi:GDP-D-mannose dehydratase